MMAPGRKSIVTLPQGAGRAATATLIIAAGWLNCTAAWATSVSVVGLFKDKAIVSIDGGKPRTLSVGQTVQGVKLIAADSGSARIDVDGKRRTPALRSDTLNSLVCSLPGWGLSPLEDSVSARAALSSSAYSVNQSLL